MPLKCGGQPLFLTVSRKCLPFAEVFGNQSVLFCMVTALRRLCLGLNLAQRCLILTPCRAFISSRRWVSCRLSRLARSLRCASTSCARRASKAVFSGSTGCLGRSRKRSATCSTDGKSISDPSRAAPAYPSVSPRTSATTTRFCRMRRQPQSHVDPHGRGQNLVLSMQLQTQRVNPTLPNIPETSP